MQLSHSSSPAVDSSEASHDLPGRNGNKLFCLVPLLTKPPTLAYICETHLNQGPKYHINTRSSLPGAKAQCTGPRKGEMPEIMLWRTLVWSFGPYGHQGHPHIRERERERSAPNSIIFKDHTCIQTYARTHTYLYLYIYTHNYTYTLPYRCTYTCNYI